MNWRCGFCWHSGDCAGWTRTATASRMPENWASPTSPSNFGIHAYQFDRHHHHRCQWELHLQKCSGGHIPGGSGDHQPARRPGSVFAIILTPNIFNETGIESSAIKFCSTNLNNDKMILVDKYSARTGLTFKNNIFSLIDYYSTNSNIWNIPKNHNNINIKYIFLNKHAPILKSELPEEINDIVINNIYASDDINIYDVNY